MESKIRCEKKPEVSVIVAKGFDEKLLNSILILEKECFPEDWQYDDAEEYYTKMLGDPKNINVFLRDRGKNVGYILARSHNESVDEMVEYDPDFKKNSNEDRFYIETIQILPSNRNRGGSRSLLLAVCEEGKRRGINKFSIHIRTVNRFNEKLKNFFQGNITKVRKIAKWKPAAGEPYEYIEWFY